MSDERIRRRLGGSGRESELHVGLGRSITSSEPGRQGGRGEPFSFVEFIPELADPLSANARRYGLSERLGPFGPIEGGAKTVEQTFAGEAEPLVEAFEHATRKVIAGGADVIIPGDGLTNEILIASEIRAVDGTPVLDANGFVSEDGGAVLWICLGFP